MSPLLNKCCQNLWNPIFCPCLDSYSLLWDDGILTLPFTCKSWSLYLCRLIVTNQTWRFSFMKLSSTVATISECEMFVTRQCLNWLLPEFHKSEKWLSLHFCKILGWASAYYCHPFNSYYDWYWNIWPGPCIIMHWYFLNQAFSCLLKFRLKTENLFIVLASITLKPVRINVLALSSFH